MNSNQRIIFEWLKEQDGCLSRLYEGAVRMLEDDSFPGRKRLICHSVREIRNRLPEVVGAKGIKERTDNTKGLKELAGLWDKEGIQGIYQKGDENHEPVAEYQVSEKLLRQVEQVISEHKDVKGRKEHNAKQLFMALAEENDQWEATLNPVVELWINVTEWFAQRAHVGKEVDAQELTENFRRFESVLLSLKGYFYEGMDVVKEIVDLANSSDTSPSDDEVIKAIALLGRPNYRKYFFKELKNPHWLEPLKEHGFFCVPADPEKGKPYDRWLEEWYLSSVSGKEPEKVLGVLKNVKCENPYVRSGCIKCLLKMPLNIAATGGDVINNILKKEFTRGDVDWLWVGKYCAELMVKLLGEFPDSAFKIAWAILDAWVSEEKTYGRDIIAKFPGRYYKELMLEYYSKVWETSPERAVRVLIKILSRCIEDLNKDGKEEGYDASKSFGYGLELGDLNEIDMKHPSIKTILVKGVCEAGKVLIDKEPGKVGELLDLLEKTNRVIFLRIAIYLLRFVAPGTEKNRINKLVGNKKLFEQYNPCWHEHRRLLNDKFNDVAEDVKKTFLDWIEEDKYSKDMRGEIAERCKNNNEPEPDFEKWENHAKAEEIYLVREKFKGEYEGYKTAAEVEDDSKLAPRRMVGETRFVSPKEGSPLTSEEMAEMSPEQVLDYVSDPNNYNKEDNKKNTWRSPANGLAATLKEDVKKRSGEYLIGDTAKLLMLPEGFLSDLFYGIEDTVRDGSFAKENWARFLEVSLAIVSEKGKDEKYKSCFRAIVGALRDSFSERENSIELSEQMARQFSQILTILVQFPTEDMNKYMEESSEKDPVQLMCVVVAGEALGVTVSLGISCKKRFPDYWESELKKDMRACWDFALSQIREPGVNCVFGIDFSRIHWLDEEWVTEKLDMIFNDDLWDETWGTYTSWGRPSIKGFELFEKNGKYDYAVDKLGIKSRFRYGKNPEEGLVEHLMTGYFNGWISLDSPVLIKFFAKASVELRAKAAEFLTTGFKDIAKEEETEKKEKFVARMRRYWSKRVTAIGESPQENIDEAIALTGWAENSVLPAKETIELLGKSLELSGGRIGDMKDAKEFVDGICQLSGGNELLALHCLEMAAADKEMHMPWSRIQEPLVRLLEEMINMPDEIRLAAVRVADAYGQHNPDEFREVWGKLRNK